MARSIDKDTNLARSYSNIDIFNREPINPKELVMTTIRGQRVRADVLYQ